MSWDITKSSFHLTDRCLAIRPEIRSLAGDVGRICDRALPSFWKGFSTANKRKQRDNYFFRFVLPVAELAGWPARRTANLPRCLSAQLLWCFAWRALDDAIDSPTVETSTLCQIVASYSDALTLTLPSDTPDVSKFIRNVRRIYSVSGEIAQSEKAGRLPVSKSWQRSSQFFIVPALVLRLPEVKVKRFRDYINAAALAHDIQDVLSDIRNGTRSAPVRWFNEKGSNRYFRPESVRRWFHRAGRELDKMLSACRERSETPILNILYKELNDVIRELRQDI